MRPLPRVLAVTDDTICREAEFGVKVAALCAAGSAIGILVRAPGSTAAQLEAFARRVVALARPAEAGVIVSGRPDLARAVGAHGVQLRAGDLPPEDARRVLGPGWIGRSVHDADEARGAVADGADYLVVGTIFASASHPGRQPAGLGLITRAAALGRPVVAIGGIDAERARAAREAGAWGVAAISALWKRDDPYRAVTALLDAVAP